MSATVLKIPESGVQLRGVPGPVLGTLMTWDYVRMVGRVAYLWGWPMVSSVNRRVGLISCSEPGLRGGILPNAPRGQICMLTDYIAPEQRFVTCSNQDVVYGFGFCSLDEKPVVIQVPDFGKRFWVCAAWEGRRSVWDGRWLLSSRWPLQGRWDSSLRRFPRPVVSITGRQSLEGAAGAGRPHGSTWLAWSQCLPPLTSGPTASY